MLSGCQGHEYYNYEDLVAGGGKLRIEFEWNGYTDIPPGMNLVFYPADGAGVPIMHQLQYDGGNVSLPAGRYDAVVYNDYTYNIYYRGMEAFATAEAYLQDYDRLPLAARAPVLRNVAEPDVFYVTQIRNLSVSSADGDRIILVYPQLKTLKLFIHVEVEGIHNVSQADGSITGAAGNVMLATGLSSGADAACKRLFPLSLSDEGLYAETSMFLGNRPLEADYVLELAFLLRNNSVSVGKFKYDVSDQIISRLKENGGRIPSEGIHVYVSGVKVDEVAGGGGFDAVVDHWGDEIDIELK